MATVYVDVRKHTLEGWFMEHGVATALAGCVVFWMVVGISLYFAL